MVDIIELVIDNKYECQVNLVVINNDSFDSQGEYEYKDTKFTVYKKFACGNTKKCIKLIKLLTIGKQCLSLEVFSKLNQEEMYCFNQQLETIFTLKGSI